MPDVPDLTSPSVHEGEEFTLLTSSTNPPGSVQKLWYEIAATYYGFAKESCLFY